MVGDSSALVRPTTDALRRREKSSHPSSARSPYTLQQLRRFCSSAARLQAALIAPVRRADTCMQVVWFRRINHHSPEAEKKKTCLQRRGASKRDPARRRTCCSLRRRRPSAAQASLARRARFRRLASVGWVHVAESQPLRLALRRLSWRGGVHALSPGRCLDELHGPVSSSLSVGDPVDMAELQLQQQPGIIRGQGSVISIIQPDHGRVM